MAGAIEQEIGVEIFRDVVAYQRHAIDHGLDDAVGEARQRHGQGIDGVRLRAPFLCDGLGDCANRHGDGAARGGLDRLAVQRDVKSACRLGDAGLLVEALAFGYARLAPHRLLRIERRLAGHLVKQVTHAKLLLSVASNERSNYDMRALQ